MQTVNVAGSFNLEHVDLCSGISILCGQRIKAEVILLTDTHTDTARLWCPLNCLLHSANRFVQQGTFLLHLATAAKTRAMYCWPISNLHAHASIQKHKATLQPPGLKLVLKLKSTTTFFLCYSSSVSVSTDCIRHPSELRNQTQWLKSNK